MNFDNDEQIETLKARFARQAQDDADLQNEIAGRDVGRIGRFLPEAAQSGGSSGNKSREERAEALTRLQMALMTNAAYAQAFRETTDALNDAQNRLDTVLERVRREIDLTEAALEDKRGRAARLEDGTRVYRDQNGAVRTEDGEIVADALAAGIVWKGDEPTYESMQADRERAERLKGIERDAQDGQARIGEMQADIRDEDNPKTEDALDAIREEAEEIVGGVEERLEAEMKPPEAAPDMGRQAPETSAKLAIPEL